MEITVADAQAAKVSERASVLERDHVKAMDNVGKAQARQAEAYKKRKTNGDPADKGDGKLVEGMFIWQKFRNKKGQWNWEGPFKIKRIINDNLFEIVDGSDNSWTVIRERLAVRNSK
jgi:hypothetical protein